MKQAHIQEMTIPAIALGTWAWGLGGNAGGQKIFGHQLTEKDLAPVFNKAVDLGLTLFDTAIPYADGDSERILGLLSKNRPEVQISTKFTVQYAGDFPEEEAMERLFASSAQRLQREQLDIYWIHNSQDIEKWTPYLLDLLRSGKVKKVGVSNHNLAQIKRVQEILRAGGYQLHAIQNHYSLVYPTIGTTGILDYCRQEGIAVFAYMILEQGALSGKYTVDNPLPADSYRGRTFHPAILAQLQPLFDVLSDLADHYQVSQAQLVIAHSIAKGMIPIIGVTSLSQVQDAAQAAEVTLTPADLARIEAIAKATGVFIKGGWEGSM